jgi:hypothetical protein
MVEPARRFGPIEIVEHGGRLCLCAQQSSALHLQATGPFDQIEVKIRDTLNAFWGQYTTPRT